MLLLLLALSAGETRAQWVQTGPFCGGYFKSIAVSDTKIFAGAYGDGLFCSTNGGSSWTKLGLDDGTWINAVIISSNGTRGLNLFVGANRGGVGEMHGIILSTDEGMTWTEVNSGMPENSDVTALAVSPVPAGGSNLFAATNGAGLFVSTNNGSTWSEADNGLGHPYISSLIVSGSNIYAGCDYGGVFVSTDNGTTWASANSGLTNIYVTALAASADGTNIFAGTEGGIFLSINNGASWTAVSNGLTNLHIRSIVVSGTNVFAGTDGGGIFLSTNNGTSWSPMNTGLTFPYAYALAVIPNSTGNPTLVAGTWGSGIFVSGNNGTSWTSANTGLIPRCLNDLAVSGTNIIVGTNGCGALISSNNGASWNPANTGNSSPNVYALAVSHNRNGAANLIADAARIILSSDNGESWTQANTGNFSPGDCHALSVSNDGTDSVRILAGNQALDIQQDEVFISVDNGMNWTKYGTNINASRFNAIAASGASLFAGTNQGVFRTTDEGATWIQVNNGLTSTDVVALISFGSALFAGTDGGGLVVSNDGGMSWTQVNGLRANCGVFSLKVHGAYLFAGTSDGVYLTADSGRTWIQATVVPGFGGVRSLSFSGENLFVIAGSNEVYWTPISGLIPSTHLVTFQADMSALNASGFNPLTDSIVVNGSFNNWNSTQRMSISSNPNLYIWSVSISASTGREIEYKFKAFLDSKFQNNGWESGNNRMFTLAEKDTVLSVVQPRIEVNSSGGSLPTVSTTAASEIGSQSAAVNGYVNPNGSETTVWFGIGYSSGSLNSTPSQNVGSGSTSLPVSFTWESLTPSTKYYFQLVAQNSAGTQWGNIDSFTTLPATGTTHLVTFQADMSALIAAGFIPTADSIVVNGSFNAWSSQQRMTQSFGHPSLFTYTVPMIAEAGQGIQYKFKAFPDSKFENGGWESEDNRRYEFADRDTILSPVQPRISVKPGWISIAAATNPATSVTSTSAVLNGSVNPCGFATTAWFEWGTSSSLETYNTMAVQTIGAGTSPVAVTANLTGLNPSTTYYYRVAGQNSTGSQVGSIESFTTAGDNSFLFDGTSGRVRITDASPANANANPSAYIITGNAMTVEAWICPFGFPADTAGNSIVHRPIAFTDNDPGTFRLFIKQAGGTNQAAFSISDGTPSNVVAAIAPGAIPIFEWTHLAGTYDGSSVKIYVNGQLAGSLPASIQIGQGDVGLYIGMLRSQRFEGLIDEVRLWNVPLTQTEIQAAMNTELTGEEAGLAGYWSMNSTFNENVVGDATPNHNDLIAQSTQVVPVSHLSVPCPVSYSVGQVSLDFGTMELHYPTTRTLSIHNTGSCPLVGCVESSLSSPQTFLVTGGDENALQVSLSPSVVGSVSGDIVVRVLGGQPSPVSFTISGITPRRFDGNNIAMLTMRDGRFAQDPNNHPSGGGLEWPKGSGKKSVYMAGIWASAMVGGSLRTATAWYWSEFSPGPIVNGAAANPNDTAYHVYKIQSGDNALTNPDYKFWPAGLGAPVNSDGTPRIIGNQTLFSVYNDLGTDIRHFGTAPLGAEVQQTIFGFNQPDARANTVFLRFKVVNKSTLAWKNTYLAIWSDPDLGDATDDLTGVDTLRSLAFVYNGTNPDTAYGMSPPAVGFDVLKGAFYARPIQSFAYFLNGTTYPRSDPSTGAEAYYFMQGRWADGTPYTDPLGGFTTFPLSGDPVAGTGWIDTNPGDRRIVLSTGPFDLEPGQSKEIIAAIVMGQGASNLNSLTVVRGEADQIRSLFDSGEIFGGALENVASATIPADSTRTIDDIANSGAQLTATGGSDGATVETSSYAGPPPGAKDIATPSIAGVGKYLDVQVEGEVAWPVGIKIYYTRNDLIQAGVVESDLQGLYYWSGASNSWNLYSNSGDDDQGRGPSTTWVDTVNVNINGVSYEGFVAADAYHLTGIVAGANRKSLKDRYEEVIRYAASLPDSDYKKPGLVRKAAIAAELAASYLLEKSGKFKNAAQRLVENVINHLTLKGHSDENVWVTYEPARLILLKMVSDLADLLQRPQAPNSNVVNGPQAIEMEKIPEEYGLSQNYPNPFNPATTIDYQLPVSGNVTLTVYDILGREVATLVSGYESAGYKSIRFDAGMLPSGVYFYRIEAGSYYQVKKMLLVK